MKNILIIGGSSEIGKEIANSLDDCKVYIASRTDLLEQKENQTSFIYDPIKDEINKEMIPESLDGFVYCPGTVNLRPFSGTKVETFVEDFEINVLGAIRSLKFVLQNLKNSSSASIVFFSSVVIKTGMPFHSSIGVSKGAIEGLSKNLAAELAPTIRVNTIAPSIIKTKLTEKFLNSDVKIENSKLRHPLKQIGHPKDIASLVKFLISDESKWITGQAINIDGGIGSLKIN
mgnify:FL=1|tara:strand:+ start:510 stop:1202 length:693 start_codon:yes stop_codon:yes gene_type:complete